MRSRLAFLLLASVTIALPASADTKIKTKSTAMGHSSESSVYIKGARKRDEMNFGPMSHVSILQCDQKRVITLCEGKQTYTVYHLDDEETPAAPAKTAAKPAAKRNPANTDAAETETKTGGVQTINVNTTDTGERQTMFGFPARHVKTSMKMVSSPDACSQNKTDIETDGWYADLSPQLVCLSHPKAYGGMGGGEEKVGCRDRMSFHRTGNGDKTGYPLKMTTTIHSDRGDFSTSTEVVELSKAELEPALFDVPAGYTEVASCYGKPSYNNAIAAATPNSSPTKSSSGGSCASYDPTNPFACGRWKDENGKYMGVGTGGGSGTTVSHAGSTVAQPAHEGRVRVGVVALNAKMGGAGSTSSVRQKLIQDIIDQNVDAVPLDQQGEQALFDEARQKSCDYVLFTDITDFKAPKVSKKGMFGAALGVGSGGTTPGEATVGFKMFSIGNSEEPKLESTQTGNGGSSADDVLRAAVKLESGDVVAKVKELATRK
jgi:hypothetical protein